MFEKSKNVVSNGLIAILNAHVHVVPVFSTVIVKFASPHCSRAVQSVGCDTRNSNSSSIVQVSLHPSLELVLLSSHSSHASCVQSQHVEFATHEHERVEGHP